jgi:ATP-dependent DNA helicase RecG
MTLSSPVSEITGVGPALAQKFGHLGIKTAGDLVDYYPRRYEDYSEVTLISQLRPGNVSISGEIKQVSSRYVRRGMHITEAVISDKSGSVKAVWFNQPYRAAALKRDQLYYLSGLYELRRQRFTIMNPSVELASDFPVNTARIIPIYRETKGLTSRQLRAALKYCLPLIHNLYETLPTDILKKYKLIPRAAALEALHFPKTGEDLESARRRLGFEEVMQLALASLLNKQENQREHAPSVAFNEKLAKEFVGHLPFKLTDGQRAAIWQIYLDIQKDEPMNRLVEGDVGSGKTVVAAMAALMVIAADMQAALMAPTELLARQHADTLHKLLEPLGYADKLVLLVGSLTAAQKKKAHEAIKSGQARFVIGTQALIQEKVDMHSLALIVIDEQHRFGVEQRKTLMVKAGHMPHVLSLTATPIPRSLALTLYGELDISVLRQKPADRLSIQTKLVAPGERARIFDSIKKELDGGRQAFVVCPLISESEVLDANSAEVVYEKLRTGELKKYRVGLLHGQLKPTEKQDIMERFLNHEIDALVSTTVIEVGVDVPNATVMLVESPERFGLAQLHQLRGRVGRSHHQGHCFLMLSDSQAPSRRLRALESSSDGFRLAELDLELRGPGAIYGTMQHGQLDLRIAKLTDTKLISEAREAAQTLLEQGTQLIKYKDLMKHVQRLQAVTNLN